MKVVHEDAIRINVPEWYEREDFQTWLNGNGKQATWHTKGAKPNEFSDVFMWYDNHEGSDSDMPESIWEELCKICDSEGFEFGYIHLTNIQ